MENKPKLGRPAKLNNAKQVNLLIDEKLLAVAKELGDGNISEGIRFALDYTGRKGNIL